MTYDPDKLIQHFRHQAVKAPPVVTAAKAAITALGYTLAPDVEVRIVGAIAAL